MAFEQSGTSRSASFSSALTILPSAILVLVVGWTFSPAQAQVGDGRPHSRPDDPHWAGDVGDGRNVESQPSCGTALPEFEIWHRSKPLFTSQEAAVLYTRFYHCAQPRIQHPWKRQPDGTALANLESGGKFYRVRIPKEFLRETIAHIERILEQGHARYLSDGKRAVVFSIFWAQNSGSLWSARRERHAEKIRPYDLAVAADLNPDSAIREMLPIRDQTPGCLVSK